MELEPRVTSHEVVREGSDAIRSLFVDARNRGRAFFVRDIVFVAASCRA